MAAIKFMQHFVTDGSKKVRVSYHAGNNYTGWREGKPTGVIFGVTLYAKDYGHALSDLFPEQYRNATDIQTDYFEHGSVRFFPGDEHYEAALQRCKLNDAAWDARIANLNVKRAARREGVAA